MKQRGLKKILIVVSDNIFDMSETIHVAFPKTKIQKCVVYQIWNSMKFVKHDQRNKFVKNISSN